ncbi:sigma factor-like helix-turn-helix DNA-binding protein [Massilia orientalis]|uniref:Sigma factor-like helix-turn-helix DNA-binding protein n=1 Tax=Massilia orientalis TaxID=3050128 RepID=A0ACC7MFX7_9BURK|nr:sigma factor-like helix-turn-helix DNA-binding protein [Massilia sp. YIM B02787]
MMKLDVSTRTRLAQRAKRRRRALKISCREVGEAAGVSAASVIQWEKLLPQTTRHDVSWEATLKVPPGWLRNAQIETPEQAGPVFDFPGGGPRTFEEFINGYCIWHARPNHMERTLSHAELSAREQRIATIMARRYGSEGEEASTLQAIGDELGLTRERVRQIEEKAREQFGRVPAPGDLVDRLRDAFAGQLPCRLTDLPEPVLQLLGGRFSIEGADRFFREVLGDRLINLRNLGGTLPATPEKIIVADDAPDEDLVRTVRQTSLGMIRQAGAAHVFFVVGALVAAGLAATPTQVILCARMFVGFEWLLEDEGWFWYGPGTDNRAKWTALKVLSAANRQVDIEELYAAMARARFSKQGERLGPAAVSTPMPILQILLSRFPEVQRSSFNDYRLASDIPHDAPATFLSPTESIICDALRQHGGVVSRRTLTQELVETGRIERITMNMALMSSPVFRRHDRGIWTITGFSFSPEALQAACEARRQLQLVDGWYEMEAALPRSALERGDWFAPAGSHAHLTPGDYKIVGIEGMTRYVENPIGDPYLKRFGFLVAAQGFEAGTPFVFGISSTERTLRVCAIQGGDEE